MQTTVVMPPPEGQAHSAFSATPRSRKIPAICAAVPGWSGAVVLTAMTLLTFELLAIGYELQSLLG
jgi:hypothetical protein